MLLALYLTTTIAAADTTLAADSARARSAPPAVVVHRQPTIPLVALRLAIAGSDPPGYAGAGHLIQHLMLPGLSDRVGRVGGEARVERSADAIVYTVTGPAVELEYLAGSLRSVLDPSVSGGVRLLRASQELAEERLAEWETAALHTRSALRSLVFPDETPAAGTEASARRLTRPEELETAWSQIYRPERVSIVAVGGVGLREVQRAFSDLPPATAPPSPGPAVAEVPATPLAPAEATRGWFAIAYPAHDLQPAALSVAARLVGDELGTLIPAASVEAEHWWTHEGQALVIVVAAPRQELEGVPDAMRTAVRGVAASLTSRRVREAANAVRRDMLFYSRTPDRMADVLGRFLDREGDPDASQRFYGELAAVDTEEMERLFDSLLDRMPFSVEIPPQRLPER